MGALPAIPQLRALNLAGNQIDGTGCRVLAEGLREHAPELQDLDLGHNRWVYISPFRDFLQDSSGLCRTVQEGDVQFPEVRRTRYPSLFKSVNWYLPAGFLQDCFEEIGYLCENVKVVFDTVGSLLLYEALCVRLERRLQLRKR
jgi:hypothetical protein